MSPVDWIIYPERNVWLSLRALVLYRARNRCEGSPQYPHCRVGNGLKHSVTGSTVVLTTAHLNHDTADNRMENLRAWCQRCHNTYDAPYRRVNAARTRRDALDNGELFALEEKP